MAAKAQGFEVAIVKRVQPCGEQLFERRVMVCQLPTYHPPFFFASAAEGFAYPM